MTNLNDVGKIKIKRVEMVIEPKHVYPLIRGRDVSRWSAVSETFVLAPQDSKNQREGIPEAELKRDFPKTYAYLKKFEKELTARLDRKYYPKGSPFYTMRNMASYSLLPWKIMWPEVGYAVKAGVKGLTKIDGEKPCLPDHTVVAVSCEDSREAHYICALLNSKPAWLVIKGYITLHPSPHVLDHVRIPRFSARNTIHQQLSKLSAKAHIASANNDKEQVTLLEDQMDKAAAELWTITDNELVQIQKSFMQARSS